MRDRDWGEGEKNGDKMQQEEREEESEREEGGGEKKRAILREKRRDKERRVSCTANGRQTADRDSRASVCQVDQSDDDDDDDDDSAMMSRVSLVTVTRYFDTASRSISRRVARKTEHSDHLVGRGARARTHSATVAVSRRGRKIVLNLLLLLLFLLHRYVPAQDPIEQALTPRDDVGAKERARRKRERERRRKSKEDKEREKKYEEKRAEREGETGERSREKESEQ